MKNNSIFLKLFLIALVFISIDMVFINLSSKIYQKMIKSIQNSPLIPRYYSMISIYIIVVFGLYYFIIYPKKSPIEAAFFGFIIYGIYETTNYTIFEKWNPIVSIINVLWASILFGLTTYIIQILFS